MNWLGNNIKQEKISKKLLQEMINSGMIEEEISYENFYKK